MSEETKEPAELASVAPATTRRGGSPRGRRVLMYALPAAMAMGVVLLSQVPFNPQIFSLNDPPPPMQSAYRKVTFLDPSWVLALHQLAADHADFGRHPFTFGPWGFLYHGCHPGTFVRQIAAWIGLSLVFGWACFSAIGYGIGGWWKRMAAIIILAFISWHGFDLDAKFFAFMGVFVAAYFLAPRRAREAPGLALSAALGLIALVKFSYFLPAAGIIGLITIDEILRRRRLPRYAIVFVVSLLVFWRMAGQPLASLSPFLVHSWDMARSFGDAMGREERWNSPVPFIAVSLMLLVLLAWTQWPARRWGTLVSIAAMGLVLFVCMRAGFVRSDEGHRLEASLPLAFVSILFVLSAWRGVRGVGRAALATGAIAGSLFIATLELHDCRDIPFERLHWTVRTFYEALEDAAYCAGQCASGTNLGAIRYADDMQDARRKILMVPTAGTVDVYPDDAILPLAYERPWRPRPVVQSYSVFTPAEAAMNAAFLDSPDAPQTIVLDVHAIDWRFPSIEDGLSWPRLLTLYDITAQSWLHLVLSKSPHPRSYRLAPLSESTVGFDDSIDLSGHDQKAIWVEIDVRYSLRGKVADALIRSPYLFIYVTLADGTTQKYRLPMGMARSGFLLSPIVADRWDFKAFALPGWESALRKQFVKSLRISAGIRGDGAAYFEDRVRVRFFTLEFLRQSPDVPIVRFP